MVQKHGWLSSGGNVTAIFSQVVAWYESFGKGNLRLPNPQLPFSTFTTEARRTIELALSDSAVSESSWAGR